MVYHVITKALSLTYQDVTKMFWCAHFCLHERTFLHKNFTCYIQFYMTIYCNFTWKKHQMGQENKYQKAFTRFAQCYRGNYFTPSILFWHMHSILRRMREKESTVRGQTEFQTEKKLQHVTRTFKGMLGQSL